MTFISIDECYLDTSLWSVFIGRKYNLFETVSLTMN